MNNRYCFRCCPHPLPGASLAHRYRSCAQQQHGQQPKRTHQPRLAGDGKETAKPRRLFPLGNTSSLPTKHTSPCSKAITGARSFDYQFCFCDAEGKRLAAGGARRFQDLIQHLLVKCWTVIVSLGKARDVQITLAGWFHPPAIGYPIRQNADFHCGCLI